MREVAKRVLEHDEHDEDYDDFYDDAVALARAYLEALKLVDLFARSEPLNYATSGVSIFDRARAFLAEQEEGKPDAVL